MSLSICWECLSLLVYLRWRRALFFGCKHKLPAFLARHAVFGIVVDPCASILIFIVTGLLCMGIKESSLAQAIVMMTNVCSMVLIIICGTYLGFKTGWEGYGLPSGYFAFGVNGMLSGSATVFFSYIGFDAVTSTAEELSSLHSVRSGWCYSTVQFGCAGLYGSRCCKSQLWTHRRASTWIRVSMWLTAGALVYVFYGRTHSSLLNAVYAPKVHADEINHNSSSRYQT